MTSTLALLVLLAAQDQQVGARTKAMGGSYTAFEDDPISVWLNPAGIATQPDGFAIAYQTYPTYEASFDDALLLNSDFTGVARQGWNDPPFIPSYLGVVLQAGGPENPHAFGFCFASPYQLKFPFSSLSDTDVPNTDFEQTFYRFRASYAHDFRIQPPGTEGFLNHVAVGLAVDLSVSNLSFREYYAEFWAIQDPADPNPPSIDIDATATGVGGGVGLLVGVYDNTRNFKVNLGLAWQSRIRYDFSVSTTFSPQFDSPNQYQAGVTFYLLEGMPLRVTIDAQIIQWDQATRTPTSTKTTSATPRTSPPAWSTGSRPRKPSRCTLAPASGDTTRRGTTRTATNCPPSATAASRSTPRTATSSSAASASASAGTPRPARAGASTSPSTSAATSPASP
jgi:hypothetical protein